MMLDSARLTLKQHRFEIAVAALASVAVGVVALWVNAEMVGLAVPPECFVGWEQSGGIAGSACGKLVQAFLELEHGRAGQVVAATTVLPFMVGLLGGVPLVGRELEARTAQTAWALAASRRRWFGRQLWPILVVLGATVVFAAVATTVLEDTRGVLSNDVFRDHGRYGWLVVARAFAALGLGLLCGAAFARTLPAFVAGGLVSVIFLASATALQLGWLHAQPQVVFDQAMVDALDFDDVVLEQGWRAPDGSIIREVDAMALVSPDSEIDPWQWLIDRGYETVRLGISAETARGWEPLEIAGWTLTGFVLILSTVAIVDRRRPI